MIRLTAALHEDQYTFIIIQGAAKKPDGFKSSYIGKSSGVPHPVSRSFLRMTCFRKFRRENKSYHYTGSGEKKPDCLSPVILADRQVCRTLYLAHFLE
jgi:hypothetical protein